MEKDNEREGFYEQMWKDFVSLQRGDVQMICKDAERYRWLKTATKAQILLWRGAWGCADSAIDEAMTPNGLITGAPPSAKKGDA